MPVMEVPAHALCLPSGEVTVISIGDWIKTLSVEFSDGYVWRGRPCDLSWFACRDEYTTYVRATIYDDGCKRTIALHRLVAEAKASDYVDHENSNGLDNRRDNIRKCSQHLNRANSRPSKKRTLPKGVSVYKRKGLYQATIGFKGRKIHLGYFDNPEDAAAAYDERAKQLFGEYARTNGS